jgi:hypothetical protein
MTGVRRAVAAASLVLALGGCSVSVGGDTLDSAGLEEEIRKELAKQVTGEIDVSCPEDVKMKEGDTFQCTATADDGSTRQVQVTQKDGDGNVRFELV